MKHWCMHVSRSHLFEIWKGNSANIEDADLSGDLSYIVPKQSFLYFWFFLLHTMRVQILQFVILIVREYEHVRRLVRTGSIRCGCF